MPKHNTLWRTYVFIVVVSCLSAVTMAYLEWQHVKQTSRTELKYANRIVTSSMRVLLHKSEALLQILGERLIELDSVQQSGKALTLVDALLENNPELAGFGLADPSGQLVLTSFNIDRQKLPNLLKKKETAVSFRQALETNAMVVGRTYYMQALGEWVIPARYRITNHEDEVVAVMTTGFKLGSNHSLWSGSNLPDHVRLAVIRSDFYWQYNSMPKESDFAEVYGNPASKALISHFRGIMLEQAGMTMEEFRFGGQVASVITQDRQGEMIMTAVSYDPVYGLYTFTSTPLKTLYASLLVPVSWLAALLVLFNATLYFLFRFNVSFQQDSKRILEYQATHDQLTKLPNRRYLLDEFNHWYDGHNGQFSVLFIDIDNFKASNDLHGHSVGDRILCEVAARINEAFKHSMKVRQGGDEFIILTPEVFGDRLFALCRQFISRLSQPIIVDGLEFSIRASIGVAHAPADGSKVEDLLRKADMAMYEAKRQQCDIYTYSKNLEQQTERVANIEKALGNALQRDELYLVYQPQLDANTQRVIGVEALLRWESPSLGAVSPDHFIGIAESTGLIHDIGQYVFETALNEFPEVCQRFQDQEGGAVSVADKLRLSINVSVRQLLRDGFLDALAATVSKCNGSMFTLMIEVTESLFIEDLDKASSILEKIEQIGVAVSLDDFGTGYSSLSVLSKLPINEVKIDKSFVRDILSDAQDWLLIQNIISLCKNLGIPVLAEGVETREQARMLSQHGCDLFQGYYFAEPMSKDALMVYLSGEGTGQAL